MIDLDALSIQQGQFGLDNVSLHVPKGRYALLMGKTGCGKTTVLEAIAGLRAIRAGRIRPDDSRSAHQEDQRPGQRACRLAATLAPAYAPSRGLVGRRDAAHCPGEGPGESSAGALDGRAAQLARRG